MHVKAFAKINWDLRILGKRADNFHELDSVFVNLTLHDDLSFETSKDLTLTCSNPALPVDGTNLVMKAARLLAEQARLEFPLGEFGAKIHLVKNIPMGGGMGGGSGDAASALHALNKLWNLNWSVARLNEIAAQVGSDVAYFLHGGWCLCRGRGEIVERLPGSETWPAVKILMILPPLHVATPAVYKALRYPIWDGSGDRISRGAADALSAPLFSPGADPLAILNLRNDLTDAARQVEPQLIKIQIVLEQYLPGRWLMSGSGASHFAVPNQRTAFSQLGELNSALQKAVPGTRIIEAETISTAAY